MIPYRDFKILPNNLTRKSIIFYLLSKRHHGKLRFPVDLLNCNTQVYFHNVVAKHEYLINLTTPVPETDTNSLLYLLEML